MEELLSNSSLVFFDDVPNDWSLVPRGFQFRGARAAAEKAQKVEIQRAEANSIVMKLNRG